MTQACGATDQNGPCSTGGIGETVMPWANQAWPKRLLIFASLQKNTLKIALEISCQHRQRLKLSWCSSNRMRNNGLQIEIKSTLIQCLRQDQTSICIIPSLAIQALDGGISSTTDTVTRSLYISNIPHTLLPIPRI
ncbi:hypothetical protein P692DRAFT_20337679 [Suillus brevipes Sb2]|nr:hypothetical protein P692DRAFT_20337679 [Suillus brevipes Sb2]